MDIAAFARHLLFEPSLEEKLRRPGSLTDLNRGGGLSVPAAPARCSALAFQPRGTPRRSAFPSLMDLTGATNRALVLHFFANHELLAMELMALALLRFPEAPSKFRRGLIAVILEEQKHLQLYRERMEELGLGFGAVPVSRFFWDVICATPSPLTFVAQMALTLEQANLDYSKHFLQLFTEVGDQRTAAILDVVYQEETSHVAHGVAWFNTWREPGDSDWAAYQRILPPSLTPARAKGLGFHPEARRAAGLSEEFIQELSVYAHSKGRPPTVFHFNPGCEDEIAHEGRPHQSPKAVQQVAADLAGLMAFLATPQDVVLAKPSSAQLQQLAAAGFAPPQFVASPQELEGRLLGRYAPWGQSPAARRWIEQWPLQWQQPLAAVPDRRIFGKDWAKELSLSSGQEPGTGETQGTVCRSPAEAAAAIAARLAFGPVVVKGVLGSSGRHMKRLLPDAGVTPNQQRWLARVLAEQGAVVVEPWRERVADFSMQINVGTEERAVLGGTRFITDQRGQYLGHVLGRKLDGLAPELIRAYHQLETPARLAEVAQIVAGALAATGYRGPAGIDALLYREGTSYHLYPLVEINPRYTMGRVALALDRRVHAGAQARWVHWSLAQVKALGHLDFAAFAAAVCQRYPLQLRGGLIEGGCLATNDPTLAAQVLTMILAGEALELLTPPV